MRPTPELLRSLPLQAGWLADGSALRPARGQRGRGVESSALVLAARLVEGAPESWIASLRLVSVGTAVTAAVLGHQRRHRGGRNVPALAVRSVRVLASWLLRSERVLTASTPLIPRQSTAAALRRRRLRAQPGVSASLIILI